MIKTLPEGMFIMGIVYVEVLLCLMLKSGGECDKSSFF